jgi:hypothetical protein
VIGNTVDENDDICGVAINKKVDHKISIWTRNSKPETTRLIGYILRKTNPVI